MDKQPDISKYAWALRSLAWRRAVSLLAIPVLAGAALGGAAALYDGAPKSTTTLFNLIAGVGLSVAALIEAMVRWAPRRLAEAIVDHEALAILVLTPTLHLPGWIRRTMTPAHLTCFLGLIFWTLHDLSLLFPNEGEPPPDQSVLAPVFQAAPFMVAVSGAIILAYQVTLHFHPRLRMPAPYRRSSWLAWQIGGALTLLLVTGYGVIQGLLGLPSLPVTLWVVVGSGLVAFTNFLCLPTLTEAIQVLKARRGQGGPG